MKITFRLMFKIKIKDKYSHTIVAKVEAILEKVRTCEELAVTCVTFTLRAYL